MSRFASLIVLMTLALRGQMGVNTFTGGPQNLVAAQGVALGYIGGVAWDPSGALVFCDQANDMIRRVRPDGVIEKIAGGTTGFAGDGGPARLAWLSHPANCKFDAKGNLYFFDSYNFRIRRIDPQGVITSIAGNGMFLQSGMDVEGPALQRSIGVTDLAPDASGNVYFTDGDQIRRVTPDGRIEIFASAKLPTLLTVDDSGNLYVGEHIVSSYANAIRRFAPDGTSTQFAGYGVSNGANVDDDGQPAAGLYFFQIGAIAAAGGKLYLTQSPILGARSSLGVRIRVIDENGIIHTVAGGQLGATSPDGRALPASIAPIGLTVDAVGNIAFAESTGVFGQYVLREVTTEGTLKTIAGGHPTAAPDGTPSRNAWFGALSALALNRAGDLYLADAGTCQIRKFGADGLLRTVAGTGKCGVAHPVAPAAGPDLAPPEAIAVDSRNRVYMLDIFGNSYIISTDGKVTPSFPPALGRASIAIDAKDRLYQSSLINLIRISPDGKQETIVAQPSQPGVPPQGFGPTTITALGTDLAGNVYFTGTYLGSQTDYVFRVNDDGTFTKVLGDPVNQLHVLNALSLAGDGRGNIWIANGLLNVINSAGMFSIGRGSGYGGDGGLAQQASFNPSMLAFSPGGDTLYLLENNRVRRVFGFNASRTPAIAPGGIVNAFSYTGGPIAPGELVSIFGSNFYSSTQVAAPENNHYPTVLGNIKVYFGGVPGAITAVTPTQINVFVPSYSTDLTSVVVQVDDAVSAPVSVPVHATAPGFAPVVLNQDGSINSSANRAAAGSIVTVFGTGEGHIDPYLTWGSMSISTPFSSPVAAVQVTIGGQPAEVLYAGEAPFEPVGVLQVNARIPAGVSGPAQVSIQVGDVTAAPIRIN